MKKIIVVASALYNWGETHRMVGYGMELYNRGYEIYFLGEGKYDYLVSNTPFRRIIPESDKMWFTPERNYKLMNIDTYGNDYTTLEDLESIVNEEVEILNKLEASAVVTGYRTTLSISAKIAKIPLVWCLSAVVSPMYFEFELASTLNPDIASKFLREFKSEKIKQEYMNKWTRRMALGQVKTSGVWNECLKIHGLPVFENDIRIFEGDLNLMSDASELFPEFRKDDPVYKFCGPIFTYEKFEIPECVINYHRGERKIVFIAMGSSGEKDVILKILNSVKNLPYDFFVATAGIPSDEEVEEFGDNFYFEKKVPLVDMAKFADVSIIHGGQGTVYSTIIGGCPFIGIPMFNEQQYNLENLNRNMCGIVLRKKEVSTKVLNDAIEKILANEMYRENMRKLSQTLGKYYHDKHYNANIISADLIEELINND